MGVAVPLRRCWRPLLAGLLGLLLTLCGPGTLALARGGETLAGGAAPPSSSTLQSDWVPIEQQPFYPELLEIYAGWGRASLGQVVGETPRSTLLNFYAVMARVSQQIDTVVASAASDPGLLWSPAARRRITDLEELFALAVQALDATPFPESVRDDRADEAAIQLKQVLDYVFTHASGPLTLPDASQLKALNSQRLKPSPSWTIPATAITLSTVVEGQPGNDDFLFSAETVAQIDRMLLEIAHQPTIAQPFGTPSFYHQFIYTPGYLVPPKWYLRLPPGVRAALEVALDGQTLLQIVASLVTLLIYGALLLLLLQLLLRSYRYWQPQSTLPVRPWHQDNLAWYRVLLVLPLLPLTRMADVVIDDYINFTGLPLTVTTYLFFICYFLSASAFFFYLFEALGRSFGEWLVMLRGGGSDLQLRRVSNLVMPVSRVLGALVALVLIYRLLIVLGLPSNTVLAFSAVPGLAIGLGASKLLGNLFAGLSIQTDRPLRVGEFCRIGEHLGFVSKIGLRSLELQTLESRVRIPNAVVDDETIVNYSRRIDNGEISPMQSLDLRLELSDDFSPEQIDDLLFYTRNHLDGVDALHEPLVSIEQADTSQLNLIVFALVQQDDWDGYIAMREALLMRLDQIIDQVRRSRQQLGVSYSTTADQLAALPGWITGVLEADACFKLRSCRLLAVSEYSYDFTFDFRSSHPTYPAFKDGIHAFNQRLLQCLADHGVEIPFPTSIEIKG